MVRLTRGLAVAALLVSAAAHAHLVVDMKVSVRAPAFVAAGQAFTYEVIADDLANDNAFGVVVTNTLPAGVTFVSTTAPGWSCSRSQSIVTCSAEELTPGEHVISIRVTAPSQRGALVNRAHVTSIGSVDSIPNNYDATNSVMIYEPALCTAAAPALLSPAEDAIVDSAIVNFAWTPSADGAQYVVRVATEGALPGTVASTAATSVIAAPDRGNGTWWVEAHFADCPPVAAAPRRIIKTRAPQVAISDVATGFNKPAGLAFGPGGELYVTDQEDSVVRRIAEGQVTIIAGAVGQPGSATGQFARFNRPTGITVTPLDGFIYVADTGNREVRILYTGGPFVPAFSVTDPFALMGPSAVAATLRGSIYVTDIVANRLRLLTPVTGTTGLFTVSTVANIHVPSGVAVDLAGNVYVSSVTSVEKLAPNGMISTLAAGFNQPGALAFDALGNLYVCDRGNRVVSKIAPSGLVTTVAPFDDPAGVAVAADGSVYVADAGARAVRRVVVVATEPPPVPVNRRRAAGR
jgi:uncharacterized repeat protein (TIGR01451 family)